MSAQAVERAASRVEDATERLRREVIAARDAGVPIAELARAASVTRQTIYRWIASETGRFGGDAEATLRDALLHLSALLPQPGQAEQVRRRATGDVASMIRGLHMARTWLVGVELDDEARGVLAAATDAQNRLEARV